ncbi:MAG: peptidoglycan bridge formation glycyltransferase FemA/FemB family protein [Caldilinea sp. CFX5]|nr:peptidoglycan bridge formation glycyltransferase FemA/FemB family protein [Caldilinea sp. CFX5]
MVQIEICQETTACKWDHFVDKHGGSHLQSSLWAQVKQPLGWQAIRLVAQEQGEIIAGMQLFLRRMAPLGVVAYVPRGPIFCTEQAHVVAPLYQDLTQVIQSEQIQYLNIQPAWQSDAFADHAVMQGFRPSQIHVAPPATTLLDLTQGLDTLWANIKKKRRRAIRYAMSKDLSVREGCSADIDTFYTLLTEVAKRRKGKIYTKAYYKNMWCILHQTGHLRLFVLEYQGKPVTMHWVIGFGDTLVSKLAAWSGEHGELHPNELLEWWVIQWAKAQGYRYYDFEGIQPAAAKALLANQPLPDNLVQSATSFKLSFGGQPVIFPQAVDRFFHPVLHWLYLTVFQRVTAWPWTQELIYRLRT